MSYLSTIADTLGSRDTNSVDVLIIEDEEMVADMFESWLSNASHSVEKAIGGEEALKKMNGDIDVVLLDRRMPLITGDEILDLLRSEDIDRFDPQEFESRDVDRIAEEYDEKNVDDIDLETAKKLSDDIVRNLQDEDIDCQVCMVSAIVPDFEIVDMDFDHYLVKDVNENQLVEIVESLASLSDVDETVRDYQSLRWKLFLIEEACPQKELEENDKYNKLKRLMSEVEDREGEKIQQVKQIEFK